MLRRGVASNCVTTSTNNNNTSSFQSSSGLIGASSSCGESDLNSTSAVALMTSSSLQMLSTGTTTTTTAGQQQSQSTTKPPQTDELSSTSSSSSTSNYHHQVSCRTPKLFLKKQDKNKKITSNNNNKLINNQEKSSGERKVVVVDSIRFERKTLYSKHDQTPIVVSSNPTATTGWSIDDFYGTKHRNWRHQPHSSWGRKPAQGSSGSPFLTSTNQIPHRAPLRCLLDSGLDECQPDRTDSGEFQAFVVAESHSRKSRDEAADGRDDVFSSLFERNRTSEEFHVRQREAYMRFRSGAAGRAGGIGAGAAKSTSFRPTTTTATPPNLIMINSKT